MNKLTELLRGCEHDGAFIPVNEVNRLMQEYGKYCAEQAYKAAAVPIYYGEFEDWWHKKFNGKEATE